jgi:hypothetical protein
MLSTASPPVSAALLTFEDISTSCCTSVAVPVGYRGLNWGSDWNVVDGRDYTDSGYQNGTVSGRNVLWAHDSDMRMVTSDRPFTLTSLYATAAWSDGLEFEVYAFRHGVAVSAYAHPIDATGPLHVELPSPPLGFDDIDALGFFVYGRSTPHVWPDGHTTTGDEFVIDDIQLSFDEPRRVTEPMSGAIFLSALAGMALVRRRRSR